MRPGRLLFLLCIACGVQTIPTPDGGGSAGGSTAGGATAGGTNAGGAGGSSGGSTAGGATAGGATAGGSTAGGTGGAGGGSNACAGLDEATCLAAAGCVADHCFTCSCTPSYRGCRPSTAPMLDCPQVGCAQPPCCHANAECSGPSSCAAPGTPFGCGTCNIDPGDCTDDAMCGAGQICLPILCSCNAAQRCEPGCTAATPCGQGLECSGGTHPRCVVKYCTAPADCGPGFNCINMRCVRRACAADSECGPTGTSFCVNGECYRGLGECRVPVQ